MMLQGRLFFRDDAQRYRFGANHHLVFVNALRCPVNNYWRGGAIEDLDSTERRADIRIHLT